MSSRSFIIWRNDVVEKKERKKVNTLTRTQQDVDKDLKRLGNLAKDQLRDSDQWNITWDRINELLEERRKIANGAA
jgi:hypothetical protein